MGLFGFGKPKAEKQADKLLDTALALFRRGETDAAVKNITAAAALGTPRGRYCEALLTLSGRLPGGAGEGEKKLRLAADAGYAPAVGLTACFLWDTGRLTETEDFCLAHRETEDGRFLMHLASVYAGLYSDRENVRDTEGALRAIFRARALLSSALSHYESAAGTAIRESDVYLASPELSAAQTYARCCRIMMSFFYSLDDETHREDMRTCYADVLRYAVGDGYRFDTVALYARCMMENVMDMNDPKTVADTLALADELYDGLSDEERELHGEAYRELSAATDAYRESEKERQAAREIYTSDGYKDENALSFGNVLQAVGEGLKSYAASDGEKPKGAQYIIDGRTYTREDTFGYLLDNDGIRTGYRVDNYARLYDADDRELGYFNLNGNFISN